LKDSKFPNKFKSSNSTENIKFKHDKILIIKSQRSLIHMKIVITRKASYYIRYILGGSPNSPQVNERSISATSLHDNSRLMIISMKLFTVKRMIQFSSFNLEDPDVNHVFLPKPDFEG
jgi:hypothetical protein